MKRILTALLLLSTLNAENTTTQNRGNILATDGKPIALSPLGGYVSKENPTKGKKGLQRYYDQTLAEGKDVQTSINRKLQAKTEVILDKAKADLNATEVLAMVMDSKSGAMLTMASSNRYDPLHIRQMDVPSLNPKFAEYPYESGAVMMPFIIASAINVDRNYDKKWINTDYEKFQIGENAWITDDTRQAAQRPVDVLVHSSSIGISKIAFEIPGSVFYDALTRYGFGVKSGIDLPRDLKGVIKTEALLEKKLYRANTSYGYGIMVTPIQLLKAYSMFSNNGWMVMPHIGMDKNDEKKEVLSKPAARKMRNMLIEVVARGTGQNAKTQGLSIGGKTGTAHIAKLGKYTNNYNSSFYGFAEDADGHSYTIGVLVIEPKTPKMYFASRSAVPVFKKIVDAMVEEKLLVTQTDAIKAISPLRKSRIVSNYGLHVDPQTGKKIFKEYVTFKPVENNIKVSSVLKGEVFFAGDAKELGKMVIVAHPNNLFTMYFNLSKILVEPNKEVEKGRVIAEANDVLKFQVNQYEKSVDPLDFITVAKPSNLEKSVARLNKRLHLVDDDMSVAHYSGKKTISPLKDAKVTKNFGNYTDPEHGINIFNESVTLEADKAQSGVSTVLDGKVVFAGKSSMLGKVVVMAHKDKMHTVYAQLSHLAPYIAVGQKIAKGTVLGRVSKKLIFQVTQDEKFVNPLDVVEL